MATSRAAGKGTQADRPIKVLIIGGGCAGISAAWQLAQLPGYDIEVIERQWHLGGKGASTRRDDGRILEHGLHVWLGFYENSFRMMRQCYDIVGVQHWGPDAQDPGDRLPHGHFDAAFFTDPHIGVAGWRPADGWEVWSGMLPPAPGEPGTRLAADSNPFSLGSYLAHAVALVRALTASVIGPADAGAGGTTEPDTRSTSDEARDLAIELDLARSPRELIERLSARLTGTSLVSGAVLLQALGTFEDWLRSLNFAPQVADSALVLVEALTTQMRRRVAQWVDTDPRTRWKTTVIDIVMTILVGLYRDRVPFRKAGLDHLNSMDYRGWLRKHGATPQSLASPFLTGIYDLVFAYRGGDRGKPALAAGVALRGALRMFLAYRGSMFWRMRSGMGDAVFAPLFKVLAAERSAKVPLLKSPVRFTFGSQLDRIELAAPNDGHLPRVKSLRFSRKAQRANADGPLDLLGCWPEQPALVPLKPKQVRLAAERDFDAVIFACGTHALCAALGEQLKSLPTWHAALDKSSDVATVNLQAWMKGSLEELGWLRGPAVVSALGAPLDSWADTSHALPSEKAWRTVHGTGQSPFDNAGSLAYFCGVVNEVTDPGEVDDPTDPFNLQSAITDLLRSAPGLQTPPPWPRELWPQAFAGSATALDALISTDAAANALASQYLRINCQGSERYSQSLPGSVRDRVSPLDRSVSNATLAGDWTANGLDAGCVEAAVMSGMLAAHAISGGSPSLDEITGFDHP